MNLKKEFQYYLDNQKELVKKYNGKFIVIRDQKILGSYNDAITAIQETNKTYEVGTFLIQKCEPGSANYTQTYHRNGYYN